MFLCCDIEEHKSFLHFYCHIKYSRKRFLGRAGTCKPYFLVSFLLFLSTVVCRVLMLIVDCVCQWYSCLFLVAGCRLSRADYVTCRLSLSVVVVGSWLSVVRCLVDCMCRLSGA
jgi:hypothetical protein